MDIRLKVINEFNGEAATSKISKVIDLPPGAQIQGGSFQNLNANSTVFFKGKSLITLVCGKCKSKLAEDVQRNSFIGKVQLKCAKCDSINEVDL